MTITISEFFDKYGLKPFQKEIDLNNSEKRRELYSDIRNILKQIVNFIDLMTRSSTIHSGELMLSAALLQEDEIPPVKNQIAGCMSKRPSNLDTSFRHLKENGYILIKESGGRKYVKLNYEEFPEMRLITELMKGFWECKKTRLKHLDQWRRKV